MGGPGSGRWKKTRLPGPGSYVGRKWYYDIVVIPDEQRVMPVTVPHEVVADHPFGCECHACTAYPTQLRAQLKRRARGIRVRS